MACAARRVDALAAGAQLGKGKTEATVEHFYGGYVCAREKVHAHTTLKRLTLRLLFELKLEIGGLSAYGAGSVAKRFIEKLVL